MIEPSDYERANLPDCSREYINDLEAEIDRLEADNHRFRTILKGSEEDYSYLFEDEEKEE